MADLVPIDSLDDARLDPYRSLRDRTIARRDDLFIGEGSHIVHRVLAARFDIESLLVAEHRLPEFEAECPERVPLLVAPGSVITRVVGFKFHQGALVCARRPPPQPLAILLTGAPVVVAPQINNPENLGVLVRTASALGAAGLLLRRNFGCDPFSRRTIRVSMGAVFRLPLVLSEDLRGDLVRLRDEHGFQLVATGLDREARPLHEVSPPARAAVLIGNEPDGLPEECVRLCETRVTIPMERGIDSLNVGVAAGVILHWLRHGRRP